MKFARPALVILGILLTLIGILWISQGSGIFPYPAASFMINQTPWIANGAIAVIVGLGIIWLARRVLR
ncbi:hypothetical protein EDE05_1085 [Neorhizobium sp. R1-B]|jgi:hypothetical protein|uniref:hypothetical protein n=1 Tax=Neorhizobium TaxID=1525371 RepID=UPI000CF92809|nr:MULTISPECIES: hypothetical protein [Neorhizobium]TCV71515.1 hypothetical protein EDE09_106218 [Neorhizobium sp. S3-V5DH]TDX82328.1 hypothetical protein EDE05_1085 [Neorhizobium sp. R1-B]